MLRKALSLLLFVLSSCGPSLLPAQERLAVPAHCRVPNRSDHGVCWWSCAQTVGLRDGIVPLQGIVQRVVETGVGFKGGAGDDHIRHHLQALGVKYLSVHDKSQEGVKAVQSWLDRGLPVIVSYSHATGSHAVLLTRIGRAKETWQDGGVRVHDYPVEYVDPDSVKGDWRKPWSWFYPAWSGKAYAFDPRDQAPGVVAMPQPPPLREGRLMLDGVYHAEHPAQQPQQPQQPQVVEKTVHVSPPIEVRHQMPPYYAHQLPFRTEMPYNAGPPPKIPSNQDIKDGVRRPFDYFVNDCLGYLSHDYEAEYRAYKAAQARGTTP